MAEALTLGASEGRRVGSAERAHGDSPRERHITTLAVENMHCGGCICSVERALGGLADVVSARANLSQRRVSIETRAPASSEEPFIAALSAAGFKATPIVGAEPQATRSADADLLRR